MITITESNFQAEVLDATEVILVDVWTSWCGPCRAIAPAIENIDVRHPTGVKVGKLNLDENNELSGELGIGALPTLLFFKDSKVVRKMVGLNTEAAIRKTLQEVISANSSTP